MFVQWVFRVFFPLLKQLPVGPQILTLTAVRVKQIIADRQLTSELNITVNLSVKLKGAADSCDHSLWADPFQICHIAFTLSFDTLLKHFFWTQLANTWMCLKWVFFNCTSIKLPLEIFKMEIQTTESQKSAVNSVAFGYQDYVFSNRDISQFNSSH